MPLFDSHAHYQDEKFDTLPGGRDALLRKLLSPASDVCGILNAATDLPSSEECIVLAEKYPQIYAAVGVHPEDCGSVPPEGIGETIERLSLLCRHPKAVAIGEIGLDYYREENPPRAHQRAIFEAQLDLAEREDLPVVVHDREAHGDTLEILLRHPRVRGVLHSFSGSREMAAELAKRGWYFSFSGVITFKNAVKPGEVLRSLPRDRILTETDCPYLAPVPMRGRINHSGYLHFTAEKQATLLSMEFEDFAALTLENTRRLFGISIP